MRVGIYGFKGDPLHNQHRLVAEQARVQHNLDVVYFVTAGQPADKPNGVTDREARHALVELAIADNPFFKASRVEIDRDGPSFMADTLRAFHAMHGEDAEYFLIIGRDRAPTIRDWHEPEAIAALCTFLVATRNGEAVTKRWLKKTLPAGAKFEPVNFNWSSTFIRESIAAGKSVRYLVPDELLPEIERLGLYGATKGSLTASLKKTSSRRHPRGASAVGSVANPRRTRR